MAEELDVESVFKLKVDGLKLELTKRGLSKTGSKAELQQRLIQYVSLDSTAKIFENENLDDTTEDTTEDEELKEELEENLLENIPTPTATDDSQHKEFVDEINEIEEIQEKEELSVPVRNPLNNIKQITTGETTNAKKQEQPKTDTVKKIVLPMSESEKLQSRGKRFGGPVSESEKKKSRAEKFGSSIVSGSTLSGLGKPAPITVNEHDKIKKRAERFGAISSVLVKENENDKIKQRQNRFADDRIKKRQERFGVIKPTINPNADIKTKKQQRALKFGV